jgi:hypothetical protein
LSSSFTGRQKAAQQIARHLPPGSPDREKVGAAVDAVLAWAAGQVAAPLSAAAVGGAGSAAGAPGTAPVWGVVSTRVPEALGIACRTEQGVWSETRGGDVGRQDFVTYTPPWLIEAAAAAAGDAPPGKDATARLKATISAVKAALGVLWAHLMDSLPVRTGADLGETSADARRFRELLIRLWTATETFEVTKTISGTSGEATAARTSLIGRVRSQARPYLKATLPVPTRPAWRPAQKDWSAWWRPYLHPGDDRPRILLAMHWTLVGQMKREWPGVTDETSLRGLGVRYGCIDPSPPVTGILSGGAKRLAVLSLSVTEELLAIHQEEEQEDQQESEHSTPVTPSGVTEPEIDTDSATVTPPGVTGDGTGCH